MTINADQLRTWGEQLCTLPPIDLAEALAALGIPGSLAAKSDDYALVEPPPAGASRVGLSREHLGANKGKLGQLEITPSGASITRAELDRRFGEGNELPRVDFDRPHEVSYELELAGAPFRCTVFASFADPPSGTSGATMISLRRTPVRPAAR